MQYTSLSNSFQTMSVNDDNNSNNVNNSYNQTINNMVFIDWQDIKWDILDNPSTAVYRNFNDEFISIPDRYLNAFAFPEEAARCINSDSQPFPVELYIPCCGCKNCESYIKLSLTPIDCYISVKELLTAIHIEYMERKVTISELCKNDTELFIKQALNRLNNNLNVELFTIMNTLDYFDNITKYDGKYYLTLKNSIV